MKQYSGSRRALALRGLFAGLALAVVPGASAAQAAVISTGACNNQTLTQPFLQWGDSTPYELASGGDFEHGSGGWTFSGGARIAAGSEPYGVTGSVGANSLYLPAGASATSPATCVTAAYPTFRLLARNAGLLSILAVQVVYTDPILGPVSLPVGAVLLSGSWQPTLPMLTTSAIQGVLSNGSANVSLRFTELTGASQIDDVFVDPRMK
jgi:hypothetical protein